MFLQQCFYSSELVFFKGPKGTLSKRSTLNGKILEDLSRSSFIMIPKKPGPIECELHRTISLMSHIIKLIRRIIMTRIRRVIRTEISQTQCGFVADLGTRNAIFMIRLLSEKAMKKQKDLYICFLDCTKAFDRVKHEKTRMEKIFS